MWCSKKVCREQGGSLALEARQRGLYGKLDFTFLINNTRSVSLFYFYFCHVCFLLWSFPLSKSLLCNTWLVIYVICTCLMVLFMFLCVLCTWTDRDVTLIPEDVEYWSRVGEARRLFRLCEFFFDVSVVCFAKLAALSLFLSTNKWRGSAVIVAFSFKIFR